MIGGHSVRKRTDARLEMVHPTGWTGGQCRSMVNRTSSLPRMSGRRMLLACVVRLTDLTQSVTTAGRSTRSSPTWKPCSRKQGSCGRAVEPSSRIPIPLRDRPSAPVLAPCACFQPEQPVGCAPAKAVALASDRLEARPVGDLHPANPVSDHAGLLQLTGCH